MSTHIYNWLQRLTLMGLIAAVALVVFPLITSGNTAGDAFLKIDGVAGESRIDVDGDSEVTRVRTESRTEHSIEVRCEDGVCEERESSASANICDGYQCPDGSCVSSRDMCIAEVERQREAPSNVVNIQNDPPVAYDRTEQRREAGSSGYFEGDQQRSQGAAADSDTNVCDGVTCSDGNCAATPEECGAVGANYNNSRSNRANIGDLDGDGVGDVQRTQDYNSSRSNKPTRSITVSPDCDDSDDSCVSPDDFIVKAQDYNSTRSNRRKNSVGQLECRATTCPDGSCAATEEQCEVPATERTASDNEIEVYAWSWGRNTAASRGGEGHVYSWGQGVSVALAAVSHNTSRSNVRGAAETEADDATATSTRVLRALEINGQHLREWNDEQRENLRRFQEEAAEPGSPEFIAARISSLVLANDRIEDLVVSEVETSMYYRDRLRLFGFIPVERDTFVRGSDVDDIEIDYPWYSFLASKPERENIRTVFSSLSQELSAGGGGAGRVSLSTLSFDE